MEDLLGWGILLLIPIGCGILVYLIRRAYLKQKAEAQREEAELERRIQQHKDSWKRKYDGATHVGNTKYNYITDTSKTTVTERATGKKVSYVHTNDDGPDLLTTMIVADMLFNHKDSSSGTVKWDNDVPTVTTTSTSSYSDTSDDTSRKTAGWSSDSSPSSYDSGPSYSSSSDSGPSSDW